MSGTARSSDAANVYLSCPNCRTELTRHRNRFGALWKCASCGGRAAMVAQVRAGVGREAFRQLWGVATGGDDGLSCPSCTHDMGQAEVGSGSGPVRIDSCRSCQLVWFDDGEAEQIAPAPAAPLAPAEAEAAALARQTVAREMVRMHGAHRRDQIPQDARSVFAMVGLPVEHRTEYLMVRPVVTWAAAALIALAFLYFDRSVIDRFAFLPAEPARGIGITLLSSFFLHDGWIHVATSIYFLLVFGDDVEGSLGKLRFGGLLLAATFASNVAHGLFTTASGVPCLGAGAAVSAVLVYYAMAFPCYRIGLATVYLAHYCHVSARGALLFWLGTQVFNALWDSSGVTPVSVMAHAGGIGVGLLFWKLQGSPSTGAEGPRPATGGVGS